MIIRAIPKSLTHTATFETVAGSLTNIIVSRGAKTIISNPDTAFAIVPYFSELLLVLRTDSTFSSPVAMPIIV